MTLDDVSAEVERRREALENAVRLVAQLRKRVLGPNATDADREELERAQANAQAALDAMGELERELMAVSGITEEMLEAIEAEREQQLFDPVDRSERRTLTGDQVEPTAWAEEVLPGALEQLLKRVDPDWLREEAKHGYRLGEEILTQPLSLLRGVRLESETQPIHRFAQMLLVAQDGLNQAEGYDQFAGALLSAQVAALGNGLEYLAQVSGDVEERVTALWRLPSDQTDATVYELLVAAACAREGRKMEFLTTKGAGQGEKVPDLRVHDYAFPMVVECKRRPIVLPADVAEEAKMRELFQALRTECVRRGLYGLFELVLNVEPTDIPIPEVVAAAMQQRLAYNPGAYTSHAWGRIALQERPSVLDGPPTPLYSPDLLGAVFNWSTDLPPHDGLICQVDRPDGHVVDRVTGPVGLAWSNESPAVFRRRARTVSALFAKAVEQIPPGEMGMLYICYQEGDREDVADDRTRFLREQMQGWKHSAKIRIPLTVLSRLVPRPLDYGRPDLVETAMPFISEQTGGSVWLQDFPTRIFTEFPAGL